MKKFKKMLVALCLCVCVALSAGLVGCADSKTLAEIDDLKAKIEQKDTTLAEKDAEIEDKNAQIEDLTPSTLEKIGIMAARFGQAEKRSYINNADANVFLVKKNDNKAMFIEPSHPGSSLQSTVSSTFDMYQMIGVDESLLVIGRELITSETEEDGTYTKNYMLTEYSKNKYSISIKFIECDANDETKISGILEEKFELSIVDGRTVSMTREHRYQSKSKSAENQVDVYYWKGETIFSYTMPVDMYEAFKYSDFKVVSIDYTTTDFNLDYDSNNEATKPTNLVVACFSGSVKFFTYQSGESFMATPNPVVAIEKVSYLYGLTLEDNADANNWGLSTAGTLTGLANTSESGAFSQAVSVMGKKIYETK